MEPRPSRPNRPASGSSRSQRAPWVPPETSDDLTSPRTADIYTQPAGSATGGPWYGPHGSLGPEPPEYRAMKPPMPIKPRSERGNKWLRYLFAVVLLALIVGGSAFAATRLFGGDDDDGNETPQVAAVSTEEAGAAPTPTQGAQAAEPTPTEQPAEPTPTEEAAAAPDEEGAPAGESEQQAAPTEEVAAAGETDTETDGATTIRSAGELLPATDQLDGVWTVYQEGERSKDEVAAQLGDDGDALLTDWRWRENVYRDFTRDAADGTPEDANFVSVSVHRFSSESGASQALQFLADIVVSAQGLQDTGGETIGEESRGLAGPSEGANLYVLYVRDGNYVIRLGGSSPAGDPAPFIDGLAGELIAS